MNLTFKSKVLLGMTLATLFLTAVAINGLWQAHRSAQALSQDAEHAMAYVHRIGTVERLFGHMIQEWKNTLLRGSSLESFQKHAKAFDTALTDMYTELDALDKQTSDANKVHLEKFRTDLKNLESAYKSARSEYINEKRFDPAGADKAVKGIDRGALDAFKALSTEIDKEQEKHGADRLASMDKALWMTIFVSLGAGALALVLMGWFLGRTIGVINGVISALNQTSDQVASSSQDMSSTSTQLASATTEQAASLEETATALQEINSMLAKSMDYAKTAAESSNESARTAGEGKVAIEKMIQSTDEISASNNDLLEQMNRSNTKIAEIVRVIGEIGEKTKVINEIVFQTKLLSFNASVEAARAGEHGKGFAVVAEEVGNLAAMSGNAAHEITTMLDESIRKVEQIVNASKTEMDKLANVGRSKVQAGMEVARQCSDILDTIVDRVNEVARMANEISSASREQVTGVNEISNAISQLDAATQSNSGTSQLASRTAADLSTQAETLRGLVVDLVNTVQGQQNAAANNVVALHPRAQAARAA